MNYAHNVAIDVYKRHTADYEGENMPGRAFMNVTDYSNEIGTTKLNTATIDAANFTAQGGLLTALAASTEAIIRGNVAGLQLQIPTNGGNIAPTNPDAQIETTWLILYTDDSPFLDPGTDLVANPGYGKPFQLSWPCAEYAGHLTTASDEADLTNADMIAFVNALEALMVSPYGGDIVVTSIQVGAKDN